MSVLVAKWNRWIYGAQWKSLFLDLSLDSKVCGMFSVSKWLKPVPKFPKAGVWQSGPPLNTEPNPTFDYLMLCGDWIKVPMRLARKLPLGKLVQVSGAPDQHPAILQRARLSPAALPCSCPITVWTRVEAGIRACLQDPICKCEKSFNEINFHFKKIKRRCTKL